MNQNPAADPASHKLSNTQLAAPRGWRRGIVRAGTFSEFAVMRCQRIGLRSAGLSKTLC
jgi:hypothetical protein